MIDGNDLSNWQSGIIPADFEFFKASDGLTYKDPTHDSKVAQARPTGEVVGHYHFLEPNGDPAAQMRWFVQCANPQPGDVMAVDYEVNGCTEAEKDAALAALQQLLPTHQDGLYESFSWWQRGNKNYGDFLWIADYNGVRGFIVPQAMFDQYTSTPYDKDVANEPDRAALTAWAHAKETDMPLTDDDANKVWTVKTQTPGGPEAAIDLLRSLAVDGAGIPLALLEAKFPHNGAMVPVADALNEILTKLENASAPSGAGSLSDADVDRIAAAVTARLAGEIK